MNVGNTKYGDGALQKNTKGSNNSAFGICSSRDTDISWNTSVGAYANMSNVSGVSNTAVGTNSHLLNISGSYNTALGTATLLNNTSNSNTAVGSNTMEKNTDGKENVAVGVQAGYENTSGEKNVFIGSYAGFKNYDGSENIFLGNNSGNNPASNISIGSRNSFLGANTGIANIIQTYNNSTAIGYGSIIDASNQIMMGTSYENIIIPGNAYLTNLTGYTDYTEQSIVSKKYIDTFVTGGIQITKPCRCATTDPIDLSNNPTLTGIIDTIPIDVYFDLSRVLVRCQDTSTGWINNESTSSVDNGIYVYHYNSISDASFTRATDCSLGANVKGQATLIVDGSFNKSNIFVQTNYDASNEAIVGTYPLEYTQFVKLQFSIGDGLQITGDTLQVKPDITNTAGNPYLTNIGMSGTLNVGGDASFNSKVDVSGTLNVTNSDTYINNVRIGRGGGNIDSNTVLGTNAGNSITYGTENVFIGYNSGSRDTSGNYNTFIGSACGVNNTYGNSNTFIGKASGNKNTSGGGNIFLGSGSGFNNIIGTNNVYLGTDSGTSSTGSDNISIGAGADTMGGVINSIAIGRNVKVDTSNTIVIGTASQTTQIPGKLNVPNADMFVRDIRIGYGGGNFVRNTAIGNINGSANTTGQDNTFVGSNCGNANTGGSNNTFLGCFTGNRNTNGSNNTYIGKDSGNFNITGNRNTFIGRESGLRNTGSDNVCIGNESDCSGNITNSVAIGSGVKATATNTIVIGTSLHTTQIPGGLELKKPLLMNDTTDNNKRQIYSSTYFFYDNTLALPLTVSGSIVNTGGILNFQNSVMNGNINFILKDNFGVNNTPLQLLSGGTVFNKNVSTAENVNITMNEGTGIISQQRKKGDISTTNNLKKTIIAYDNSSTPVSEPALEIFEVNGRGAYFVPNCVGGAYGPNVTTNDFAIVSRHYQVAKTALCFCTGTSLRNHLRLTANTDLSECSLILQNGANAFTDTSEFRMDYNFNATPKNTISFNNPIDFNRETINSNRRLLKGLGTLSFTDISGNNTTTGSFKSAIWTDSSLSSSGIVGMYYDCGINGGFHKFSTKDSGGTTTTPVYYGSDITSISNTFVVRNATTSSNRLDISVDSATPTATIRARSSTASTSAILNLNLDTVSALGVVAISNVATLTPFYMEIRRPILFNYTTYPAGSTNLGFQTSDTIAATAFTTQTTPNNLGSLALGIGTWEITLLLSFQASGNHTYTIFSYGINSATGAFPTAMPYLVSYMREPNLNINTVTITKQISMTLQLTTATTIYFVEQVVFGGGGNTTIGANYTYTRIG